jgi:hypothetical protein
VTGGSFRTARHHLRSIIDPGSWLLFIIAPTAVLFFVARLFRCFIQAVRLIGKAEQPCKGKIKYL